MRKLAKQLQIDVRDFSEMQKKTKNERRFDVTLGYSITVRDVTTKCETHPRYYCVFLHLKTALMITGVL